jgi:hypothetical protein
MLVLFGREGGRVKQHVTLALPHIINNPGFSPSPFHPPISFTNPGPEKARGTILIIGRMRFCGFAEHTNMKALVSIFFVHSGFWSPPARDFIWASSDPQAVCRPPAPLEAIGLYSVLRRLARGTRKARNKVLQGLKDQVQIRKKAANICAHSLPPTTHPE